MNPSQNAIVRASEKEVLERLVQLRTARTPNRRLAVAADPTPSVRAQSFLDFTTLPRR